MTSLFPSKPIVTPLDDRITVSFTIPAELLDDFSKLFESLSGFIRTIECEKHLARAKSHTQSDFQAKQAEQTKLLYYQRIVKAYDEYTSQGLSHTVAIKQISTVLSKENHPWAFMSFFQVKPFVKSRFLRFENICFLLAIYPEGISRC